MLEPFEDCLTPEIARRIVAIRAPEDLSDRIQELADKNSANALSGSERQEYEDIAAVSTRLAILQAKARALLGKL